MSGTGSKERHALVLICVTQRASKSEKACGVLRAPCSYQTAVGVNSLCPHFIYSPCLMKVGF